MITPSVPTFPTARPADFEELTPVTPPLGLMAFGVPGRMRIFSSPNDEMVAFIGISEATKVMARALAALLSNLSAANSGHLCLQPVEAAEEGFAEELDEATEGRYTITLVDPVPVYPDIEAAVEAVPLPEGKPAALGAVRVSERDFDRLVRDDCDHEGKHKTHNCIQRLMPAGDEEMVGSHWPILYWLNDWPSAILARAFFDHYEIQYQLAEDATDHEPAILTSFASAGIRQRRERRALRARLMSEKAAEKGDHLEALFHLEGPEEH